MTAGIAIAGAYLLALTSALRVTLTRPTYAVRAVWGLAMVVMAARVCVYLSPNLWPVEVGFMAAFGISAHVYGVPAMRDARYSEAELQQRVLVESGINSHVALVLEGILKTWFYHDLTEDDCDSGFIRVNRDGEIVKSAGGGARARWAEDRVKLWHAVAWRAHEVALHGKVARYDDQDGGLDYWVQVRPWREAGRIVGSRFAFMARPQFAELVEASDAEP